MTNPEQAQSQQPSKIDIISDIVCPWCVIGYRQLVEALEQTNTNYVIKWHPFELNPNLSKEGENLREHSAKKHGRNEQQIQESRERMKMAGREVGFEFNFNDETRVYNTFDMHQLLCWADQYEHMNDLAQALFKAHFTDNRNLAKNSVLADIAAEVGLNHEQALTVLDDQRFANDIREEEQRAREQGIQSVPTVIFNDRHLISGAQGVDNYVRILEKLAELNE